MSDLILLVDNSISVLNHRELYLDILNHIIFTQRELDPDTNVTLRIFSGQEKTVFANRDIKTISDLDRKSYDTPNGTTALYDAIGRTISKLKGFYVTTDSKRQKTLIVLTDGDDTTSRRFSPQLLNKALLFYSSNWRLIFIGATKKATDVSLKIGFHFSIRYSLDEKSIFRVKEILTEIINSGSMVVKREVCDLTTLLEDLNLSNDCDMAPVSSSHSNNSYTDSVMEDA